MDSNSAMKFNYNGIIHLTLTRPATKWIIAKSDIHLHYYETLCYYGINDCANIIFSASK